MSLPQVQEMLKTQKERKLVTLFHKSHFTIQRIVKQICSELWHLNYYNSLNNFPDQTKLFMGVWNLLPVVFQHLRETYKWKGDWLFTQSDSERESENGKEKKFLLDFRGKLFTQRVVRHWYMFPREVVDASSVETR